MSRWSLAAIAALLLAVTSASASCDGDTRPPPAVRAASAGDSTSPSPALGPPSAEGARTMAHIEKLAATPRVAGSTGSQPAAAYVADQFRASGYTVELMTFPFEAGGGLRTGSVKVGDMTFEVTSLGGGAGGKVTAQAVYVGLADTADVAGKALAGKIAVADRGAIEFGQKYDNVVAQGALALVLINNQDGVLSGTLGKTVDQPAVAVSRAAADALRAAPAAGTPITVDMPVNPASTGTNVIAKPSANSKCAVLVGGHRDSVAGTGGANDNASGAAAVLEIARAFAADGLDEGLCFVTFDAEEEGLFGSKALAKRMQAEGTLPKVMLNLDDAGAGTVIELIGDPSVSQRVAALAKTLTIPVVQTSLPPNTGSDHLSFQLVGVPVLLLGGDDFSNIHTARDTIDKLNTTLVNRIGKLTYAAAAQYLSDVGGGR